MSISERLSLDEGVDNEASHQLWEFLLQLRFESLDLGVERVP